MNRVEICNAKQMYGAVRKYALNLYKTLNLIVTSACVVTLCKTSPLTLGHSADHHARNKLKTQIWF